MQPHAGVAQNFGNYIAGVLFTNRHTFRILLCTFHPQIGVCLDGLLMTILGQVHKVNANFREKLKGNN